MLRLGLLAVVLACLVASVAAAAPARVAIPFGGSFDVGNQPRGKACRGRLVLELQREKQRLDRRGAKLSRTCQFKVTFYVSRKALGKAKKLKVVLRFKGNQAFGPSTQTFIVDVP